jgi:hypothetical protein
VLQLQLGRAELVCETLSLVLGMEDTHPEEMSDEAKLAFARWMKAARAATEAGMQGLGDGECSFFEVRCGWRH